MAQFLTGHRLVPVRGPGVGDPCFIVPFVLKSVSAFSLMICRLYRILLCYPEVMHIGAAVSVLSTDFPNWTGLDRLLAGPRDSSPLGVPILV